MREMQESRQAAWDSSALRYRELATVQDYLVGEGMAPPGQVLYRDSDILGPGVHSANWKAGGELWAASWWSLDEVREDKGVDQILIRAVYRGGMKWGMARQESANGQTLTVPMYPPEWW